MKKWISFIITFSIIMFVIIVGVIVTLNAVNSTEFFESRCEDMGGKYYELQNTSCEVGYRNCILICEINGEYVNYYERDKLMENITIAV